MHGGRLFRGLKGNENVLQDRKIADVLPVARGAMI